MIVDRTRKPRNDILQPGVRPGRIPSLRRTIHDDLPSIPTDPHRPPCSRQLRSCCAKQDFLADMTEIQHAPFVDSFSSSSDLRLRHAWRNLRDDILIVDDSPEDVGSIERSGGEGGERGKKSCGAETGCSVHVAVAEEKERSGGRRGGRSGTEEITGDGEKSIIG